MVELMITYETDSDFLIPSSSLMRKIQANYT
jgi:hypothetical protein